MQEETIALALFGAVSLCAQAAQAWQSSRMSEGVFAAAADLAAKQHEAGAKYSVAMMQMSIALAKQQEDAVRARVQFVNRVVGAKEDPAADVPFTEAPPPPLSQTGSVDDYHEIVREAMRFRHEADRQSAQSKRDLGVGVAEDF